MCSNLKLLNEARRIIESRKVHLRNGQLSVVSHMGSYGILKREIIKEVLYVPEFKYNLLFVSKLQRN